MLGTLVTFSVVGLVGMISLLEILRYRSPRHHLGELAYTRRRLSRRLGANILLVAVVLMIYFKPDNLEAMTEVVWLSACLAAGLLIFLLVLRDLRETSAAVVREHQQFLAEAEREMLSSLPEIQAKKSRQSHNPKG